MVQTVDLAIPYLVDLKFTFLSRCPILLQSRDFGLQNWTRSLRCDYYALHQRSDA